MSIQEKIAIITEYHKKFEAYCDSLSDCGCGECVFCQERGIDEVIGVDGCGAYDTPSEKEFETVMAFEP